MLALYMRPTCPYCHHVNDVIAELGLPVEERDIANPERAQELLSRGGKRQVPYLVDAEHGVEMYESRDIISYLRTLAPSSPQALPAQL
jgi:glutaredoxin